MTVYYRSRSFVIRACALLGSVNQRQANTAKTAAMKSPAFFMSRTVSA